MDFLSENSKKISDIKLLKRTFFYIKPYIFKFILSFIFIIINVVLEIILPLIMSSSIKEMKSDNIELMMILFLAISYMILGTINIFFIYFQSILLQKVGQSIVLKLREDVFNHIEHLSIEQFNDVPVGKLVSRVTNDTVALSDLFTSIIVRLIKNIFLVVTTYIIMFFISVKLTLYVSIFIVIVAILSFLFKFMTKKIFAKEREEISLMNSFMSENITGMKITQVFNKEEEKKEEFKKINKRLKKASNNVVLSFAAYRPLISFIYFIVIATCFAIGIPQVYEGIVDAELFFLFYIYIGHLFNPVQEIAEQLNNYQKGMISAERIFNILDIEPTINESKNPIIIDSFKGEIVFDHVWFAYTEDNWILKDVSFKINSGETIAFVGKTGAGKTTILSLIVRNYDIQKGHIYIDGIDIKDIEILSLRKNIGQMLQDVFLFSGTIKDNITLKDNTISDEDVIKACDYVNANVFINNLENKYDEEIKENGSNLSSGEKQLLSFARVLVKNPSIIILDEATSNIDTETEVLIQDSLNKMKSIGTMLIVAHRLSTIKNADRIIVIEDGILVEQGSHLELINKNGYYKKIYEATSEM